MVREKGTLINFMNDGDVSTDSVKWLLRSGKVPIGRERTQLIERAQLKKWGILVEAPGAVSMPTGKPKLAIKTVTSTVTQEVK